MHVANIGRVFMPYHDQSSKVVTLVPITNAADPEPGGAGGPGPGPAPCPAPGLVPAQRAALGPGEAGPVAPGGADAGAVRKTARRDF